VQNPPAIRKLVGGGTKLRGFPREVLDACYRATFELYTETAAANPRFKKVYEHFMEHRATQYQWFRVAENSFENYAFAAFAREQQARPRR